MWVWRIGDEEGAGVRKLGEGQRVRRREIEREEKTKVVSRETISWLLSVVAVCCDDGGREEEKYWVG